MPEYNTITYKVKDDIYDIPEDKAEAFESRYPDATQEYRFSNGDIYDIPLFKREAFEKWPEYVKDREKKIYDGLKNNVSETGKDIDVYTKIAKDRKEWWDPNTKTIYGGSVGLPVSTMKLTKKAQLLDSAERFNRASKNVIKWVDDMNAGGNAVMRNADVFMKGVADESKWIDEIGYQDAKLRNDILEKYDRGEELSQEEQVLLNAMINYEASQYQFNKLGFWAGAARGAAESVPFMLDFLLTGRLAKGISKAAIRGLEKYSRRALGKGIASGIAKATAKGAGKNAKNVARGITEGVGASALMTGTIQGYDTMADAKNRMTGDVNIGYDEDGNAIYEGRENYEKDMPSAVKKAFKSGMIENYSEMVFDALKPLTGSIGGLFKNSKVGISIANSKAGRMFENITSGDLYKWASRVKKETGIDNYFTENLEEVFGGLANAWLVGDNSVSDVFSAENLLQTAAVTGIIQAGFVPIKGGGAAVDMAIVARKKRELRRERDKAFANLSDVFGKDEAEKLDALFQEKSMEDNAKALSYAKNSGEYTDEQIKAITDYFQRQTAYDIMVYASRKKIEEGAKAVFEEARSYINLETGMEQVVALKGEEEEFYVTTGNLVFDENGKVDEKLSSVSITVKDRKGNKKMISPSDVDSLISYKSPEQAEISAHQEEQRAYDAMIREESRVVDAEDPNIGDVIRLKDDKGNEVDAVVQRRDADGKYILTTFEKGSVQDGRLSGEEIPSGSMLLSANEIDARRIDDPGEIVQEENDGNDVAGEIASEYQPSALERIPKDENGQPIYEQTDSDTAWDAILEQTEGDEAMAQNVADGMVAEKESELNKLERTKSKGGVSVAEKIAAEKERKYRIDAAKKQLSVWKSIADTANRRKIEAESERRRQAEEQAKAMRAEQERMKAEQEEAARIEREALNGVPDIVNDTPKDARSRGYRRVNGHKIDRQEPVGHLQGKEVAVKFSDDTTAKARVAVMEANQLQPSHIQGQRNPAHFIDEAQPKERNDAASVMSARKIAWNMRPEEITTSVTAYTGAPTVNTRGEVIQGNNRSAALRLMWESEKDKAADYKKYLKDHAEEFGLNADEIEAMQNPVLVNMLDVEDAEAIALGQYVAQDTESGGTERIKPKNAVQRMGKEMRTFANLLLKSADDETTFAGLVDRNAEEVLRWMNQRGYITPTQYASAFDSKGTLTAEAKNDLKSIMYQSIFQGGSTRLEQMFNAMPAKAQKAILATAFRDYDSPHSERMVGEIQNSIMAYNALSQDAVFASAKNWKEARMAVEGWKRQYYMDDVTGESYLPADKFSNFALHLATMYKGESQGLIQKTFNRIYDLIQGTQEETLFEKPDNTPRTLAQAIYETLNIQYDGQLRSDVLAGNRTAGKRGRQGSNGNAASGERVENGNGTADRAGSIESESTTGSEVGHTHSLLDVIRILYSKGKETASKLFQRSFFDVAQTPKFMQELGLRGDKFTIKYGVIARHIGKDSSHTLTERDWEQLPQALQKPFAISKLSDKEDSYRIYTTLQTESGEFVVVGADVKNVGREIEVNAISTVFGRRNNANLPKNEEVIYRSNEITPEQSSLLERPNFAQYPTEQELFADKDTNIYTNNNELYDYNALLEVENAESELATRLGEPIDELEEQIDNGIKHETRQVYHIDGNPDKAIVWVSRWEDNDPGNKKSEQFFEYKGRNIGDEVEAVLKAVDLATNVADAESEINTNPTEAQKEAGNFKKGHVQIGTFDVTIENPKGSVRSGVDANGNKWETTMNNSYGYIRGTEGVDGDHIDVFLADDIDGWNGREVFVIDQYNEDGTFDEHKVMIGFNDEADAYAAYLANYESGWADSRKIVCSSVNIEDFEKWIDSSHRKTKPFAEYKTVAKESKTVGEISTETEPSKADGYTVERRFHKKNGTYIHAVKFTEQMPRERFMELKKRVKDFGGYYSSFGKGGFIFNTEEDARKFAEAVLDQSGELLEDSEPVTLSETRKFTDQTIEKPEQETTQSKQEGTNPSGNRLVTDERYEELKKRMRAKLGKLNVGIDPEILAIGTEMAVYHIEKGARKFAEYAKAMIADLGDVVRPYLKSFYNGARDLPEVADSGMANDMTPYDDVRIFDVANFDKDHTDPFATAETVVIEQTIQKQADGAKKEIINHRNNERRKENEQTAELSQSNETKSFNGYKVGDKVLYTPSQRSGKPVEAVIHDFENEGEHRPVLDTGLAPILYEVVDWGDIKPVTQKETIEKPSKTRKKSVSSQKKMTDLFGGLFDNENLTEKEEENGLQRNDGVSSERLSADSDRYEERLSEGIERGSDVKTEESRGIDPGREGGSDAVDRTVRPRSSGSVTTPKNTRNNHSERGENHAPSSVDARIDANIKAIELANQLIENGETATPEQMAILRKFSGWGGLGKAFNDANISQRLQEILGAEGLEQAIMSANSAYYTPAYVIDTLWDIAEKMGFEGGNILEGSAGIGNILGQMPTRISERSDIHAVEIDRTSGGILSLLYPDAKVEIQGFEQTRIPNGSVDLAITNVPFVTGLRVDDTTGDKDLSKKFHNIHDFCIAKNVRKLREGGIGIFISSNGTLDNSKKLRDWIVNEGGSDFVGAFRMNNKTFVGTSVTSDIIVIRKRVNGRKSPYAIDVSAISGERTAEYDTGDSRKIKGVEVPVIKQLAMDYNRYFIEHPENMAGSMRFAFEEGETFRPTSKGLYPTKGKDQEKMLAEFVNGFSGKDWQEETSESTYSESYNFVADASAVGRKVGEMYVKDGNIVIASLGGFYPLDVNANKVKGHTKVECFNAYSAIKEALADVLEYQTNNESDSGLKPLLDRLNKAYDDFVSTYGHFNKNTAIAFLRNDVDYPNIFSLERYEEIGDKTGNRVQKFGKTDVFSRRVVEREKEPTPTNVKDGIIASVFKFGRIDIPYIAEQLGENTEDVKRDIIENKYGFENPATRQIEVSYLYLSGNVREKLRQAQENNENGIYDGNIKALQKIMPMDIPAHLIDFTLGSSWIDPKLYEEYVLERTDIPVSFTTAGGTWFMAAPDYGFNKEKNRSMGVVSDMLHKTIFGHTLIEAAIQNRTITVSQTNRKWDGTTETIIDKEATQACADKIDEIRQDFKEWAREKMQNDSDMSARMERIYNDTFNNYVPMSIPDEFVPEYFGGASHRFKMRPHQGKAIVRGTMQPLMLAHEVGTGKTFTLISTAMEMRRLGTARKPMIVVQNATVGQFVASAKELYPNAKILTLDESDRSAEGRKNFYAKIRYNDWDMIVVPQSTFEFIPDSEERQMAYIQDKIEEKKLVLEQMRDADPSGQSMITRQAQREIDQLEDQLAGIADEASKKRNAADQKKRAVSLQNAEVRAKEMLDRRTDDVENFDDMGIDALLVDEAHEYKHLGFATAMQRGVKGIDPSYSKKSQGVYLKTQAVLEKNNGRNVIFATGTPISNTAAEIWTFMRYLMPADTMSEYGIYYFDDFVRNFGNIQQMLEFTTSGKFKENNRFAGYVNLPELVRIWSGVSDTVLTREAGGVSDKIPDMEGGKAQDIYLPQTRALRGIMKFVKAQLDRYEKMSGKEKKENSHIPLTMYGIAKAAAVDARLVQADAEDDPNSKTNEAVRQTIRSLKETESYKGTVAIFADNYQNKQSGFNLYDDIRDKLIAEGIPAEQVVIMRSGMTIKKKLEIFDKVNRGEIRVILGSTFTLGTGVNIQERLHTLIHLDAPNRPMDYTQRNGRILRQGNLHKSMGRPVRILRFGVEDSLDVTAYQRLKTKGAIADSIMDGKRMMANSMSNRVLEEEEDVFGDTVAQLSGSEYALLKNNAEKNVRKYESRKKQWETDQTYIHNAKPRLKGQIAKAEHMADINRGYLRKVKEAFPNGTFTKITAGKQTFADKNDMADLFKEHNKKVLDKMKQMKEGGESSHVRELTVSLGGFVFKMSTELNKEMTRGGGKLFSEVHRKMTYSCSELGLENVPVKQGLLRNAIEDITKNVITGKDYSERIESAERSAENARSELKQLQQREGKPFEFDKELEEAKKQYAEYSELMKKELEEKEAKYAEMDTSVDDANNIYINEDDEVLYRSDDYTTKDRIEDLFNLAISGEFRGKPISIGTLTDEGKAYLEQISGVSFKDKVDFVLNPSDLIHIYNRHFGENEKDGRNIPLDIEDIRSIVDIISNPDRVIYSVEVGQQGRKMFSFLKEAEHGTYNLLEIYSDKKGNLTAKSFYKSKEGVSQRVISLTRTLHSTSETDGATLNDVAKIPQMFDTSISEDENLRDDDRLKEVNERFNEELQRQMDGTLPKGHVYGLGRPSDALLSAGMPDLPIEMASARLLHKSNQYNDPFELSEVENMPQAIQNPMAVFRSATHVGSNVILTELRQGNKNFVVAIETNRQQGKIKVNSVRSIHPRTVTNIVDWINNGLMDYVDKKQLHEWLLEKIKSRSYLNSSNPADVKKQLDLATNIVESFEKPTTEQGKIVSAIENLARELNTPVTIIRNVDEITDSDRKREHKKRGSKGWFDPVTGDIFLVLPNATSVADAQTTVLHEAVGHKGLRGLLGDRFNNMLDRVYDSLPDYEKERIDEAVRKGWFRNRRTGTEEYLASIAETDVRPSVWNRIKGAIRDFFRRLGISLRMGDADIKYMLWRSRNRLMNMDDPFEVADIVSRNFRMLEKLENEKAMEETAENIPFFRDGEETDENTLEIRDVYNHIFSSYKKKGLVWKTAYLTENFQDRYYSLKRIQELIVENSGRKLASHENAHEFSSQIAGINQAEMNYFNDTLLRALTTSIADLTKKGNTYEDITNYMHAKHGLERNRKMREDALERAIRNDEIIKELEGLSQQEDIADEVKKGYEQEIETRKQKIMERTSEQTWNRDYAGLTALYEEALSKDESISDILNGDSPLYEQYAEYLVDKFEAENGKDAVDRLWKSVRDANAWTLKKRYESGLLTRSEYDKVKGMYEYYIPLRGFDDDTADDIYQYMTNSRYNLPDRYKRTEGRTSKHEDPISVMAKMAETAITSGNRNIFKQKVLNMVLNHPTDLFTLGNVWYVNVGTKETPEWIISLPEFPQGATAEQMREISDNFEKDMQQKQKEGTATRRKGKVNLDVFSTARQDNEHTVFVKQNGIDYVIYVNGNPRVAQAINGTNVHEQGDFAKVVSEVNRFLAQKFTIQNPSFVLTNFVRDYAYSVIMSWVKNDAGYARRVAGRIFYLMPAIARAVKGKADMSKETDRMFREFVENGGETGFFKLFETEDYKRMIKRQIRDIEKPGNIRNRMLSVWKAVISPIEIMNRIAEDSSRFAVYYTSRKEGKKDVQSAISDAKEITVNFNKRGSNRGIASYVSGLYIFFNAAVQSLANIGETAKKYPKKLLTVLGGHFLAGFMAPMLNALLLDDDELEAYFNLPEYVRRSNICLWTGDEFITITLPIELRAFYGMGDALYTYLSGRCSGEDFAYSMMDQITELLPLNPFSQEGLRAFIPSAVKPVAEVIANTSFTGRKVYPDMYNDNLPEYRRVYAGTGDYFVKVSEFLNDISGGDQAEKGYINVNPAVVEHLVEGYLGGAYKFYVSDTGKSLSYLLGSRDNLESRNIPALNRFINDSHKWYRYSKEREEYERNTQEYNSVNTVLKIYRKDLKEAETSDERTRIAKKIADFRTKHFETIEKFHILKGDEIEDRMNELRRNGKSMTDSEYEKAREKIYELQREFELVKT